MITHRTFTLCAALSFTAATSVALPAQSSACKDLANAMLKNALVPYHSYMSTTAGYNGGKTKQSEMISTGTAIYIKTSRGWMKSRVTPQVIQQSQREAVDSLLKVYTCTKVGTEVVNGVSSQHYHVHGKTEDGETTQELWLGDGRLQRMDQDMDVGAGAAGKSHTSMRYEYTNVQAPPGVK